MGTMAEGGDEALRPISDGENTRVGEGSMGTVVWRKVNSNKLTSFTKASETALGAETVDGGPERLVIQEGGRTGAGSSEGKWKGRALGE